MKFKHLFALLAFLAMYTGGFLLLNYIPVKNTSEATALPTTASIPAYSSPTTPKPTVSNPTVSNPTVSNSTASKPTASKPTASKPTVSTPAGDKERNVSGKVISIEKNQYGSGGWTDFTGYNDDNIVNVYVAGKDIAPGVYWTGVKGDPCYGSVVTTAEGKRYRNLEHGEQSVFHLEKGDSLTTVCNWYQGNMPKYKEESPTGMILASQLGVGEFKVKSTGSCIIMRDYLDNFVNAKTVFVFEEGDNYIVKITKEDIEKNTVIGLIDKCGALVRV
jgi:hypothetical protein